MKKQIINEKKNTNIYLKIFLLFVCIIFAYKFIMGQTDIFHYIGGLADALSPILMAIFVAYILYIPTKKVEDIIAKSKFKWLSSKARFIGISVVYISLGLLLYIVIKQAIPFIYKNVIELLKNIPGYIEQARMYFQNLPKENILSNLHIEEHLEKLTQLDTYQKVLKNITTDDIFGQAKTALNLANGVFNTFITIVVSIYMLYYRNDIQDFTKKTITALFSKKSADKFDYYSAKGNYIFFRFISTQILDGVIVGIIISIAFLIMKVRYAIALGFLIGLFNLIPFFGAIIGVGVAIAVTAITGGIYQAISALAVATIIQQLDANILNPLLLGNSLELNKILIIAAVILGGTYFGPLGMFLAVPVVSILTIIINDNLDEKLRKKKIEKIINKRKKLSLAKGFAKVEMEK